MKQIETIIVGGGQAGLSTSYWLKQHGREHLVLEKADRPGHAWRQRWDSFTLLTPNWAFRLPGAEYRGANPHAFMPRDEIVAAFERHAAGNDLPVAFGVEVTAVTPLAGRPGYRVETSQGDFEAQNVVVATGLFQRGKIPACAAGLPSGVLQMHSGQYRNPRDLPPGAVLVVGSSQSGCQIAEELFKAGRGGGRQVFLSVGASGRVPRRYRGKDIFEWMLLSGFFDRTADMLPSPKARFAGSVQVSGVDGGHDISLHRFARDGMILLGHLADARDGRLSLAPDLYESLAKVDQSEAQILGMVDGYIARSGLDAPPEQRPVERDGYDQPQVTELDIREAGITSVIWAAGYSFDFGMVKLPVCDGDGFPVQQRGVTAYPGLYFVGMHWLYKMKSGLLVGVGEDAAYIAAHIADRKYE